MVQLCPVEEEGVEQHIPDSMQVLLHKYAKLFDEPQGLPPHRPFDHAIPLMSGARPVNLRPYRFNPAQKDEIERQVAEMLRQGVIVINHSPFSSPMLLVGKKDGTWRLCVDYRCLNAITIKNRFPLPIIDELLDELAGTVWFTCLDMRAGYHQIRLKPGEEYKTAFRTHMGHYELKVMSYGLTGGPATFQSTMNTILAPLLRKGVLVFIDDILIYSATLEEHEKLLQQVFDILRQHQFKIKRSKCTFARKEITYLGHIVSGCGVATDPKNVTAVQQWPVPMNVKEVRGFFGLAGYYRKFVKGFGMLSKPLTELLKKNHPFVWSHEQQEAFEVLKVALTSAPVLALPDFKKQFVVETDASEKGIGAVLMQDGHPLAYLSRALGPKTQGLSTYEKECMAILIAVDHWRTYLQGAEFVIRTDQQSLVHLDEQRISTPWQQKALTKLMGLQFRIVYKKGLENRAADALSRLGDVGEEVLSAVSVCLPEWIQGISDGYMKDPVTLKILEHMKTKASL
ncbi:polyprotein [Panicum miliaceum]|uniref:Polyprotein n=1 Tax=Panicum miliaceum TaxID=4540 RepID=A0A3L6TCM7_PANMI|nr:polyprotein [Panicum miliaceum]